MLAVQSFSFCLVGVRLSSRGHYSVTLSFVIVYLVYVTVSYVIWSSISNPLISHCSVYFLFSLWTNFCALIVRIFSWLFNNI